MNQQHLSYVSFLASLAREDVHAAKSETGYRPVARKVTSLVAERHVGGDQPIGVYLVRGTQTQIAVLDLDDHHGTGTWEDMVAVAIRLIVIAAELRLLGHVFRSGGGKGIHIWFIWDQAQDARAVRALLRQILETVGLAEGTTGIARGTVEIFPKQDRVETGAFGSLIALPGARASIPLDPSTLEPVHWEDIDYPTAAMRLSANVPEVNDEPSYEFLAQQLPSDKDEAESALKYIVADDYHVWMKVGLALKYGFGDLGLPMFEGWSKGSSKYPGGAALAKRWKGLRPTGGVTVGTIFHLARAGGWNGPSNPIIREMNAAYGIFTHGRTTEIILKDAEDGLEAGFIGKAQLQDRMAGEMFERRGPEGETERVRKATYWLNHTDASHYSEVIFDPARNPGHDGKKWNVWRGFAVQAEHGDWSLLKGHIFENICRRDQEIYDWVMNWMALGVQQPGLVIGTAPVLIGFPGTGKGVLAHAYGRLWGPHYIAVTHSEHVTGRFSGHLFGRRFIFVDEGMFGGNRKEAGLIKTRLTDPLITLERKGVDAITIRNTMIMMVASNEASVVPADKGDRRWMVLDVGNERREDHGYFGAIQQQMVAGGYEAMLCELLNRDLRQGPDPRKTIKTEELFQQVLLAQPPEVRYLHGVLDRGRLPQNWVCGPASTTVRAMMVELRALYRDARIDEPRLGRFVGKAITTVRRYQAGVFVIGSGDHGPIKERSTRYDFPSLELARDAFAKYLVMPIVWPDVDGWQRDPGTDDEDSGVL